MIRPPFARHLNLLLAAIIAAGVPLVAIGRLMLAHFYVRGAFLMDSGLLASLVWHSDARLTLPSSLGGSSYLATHFSPVLLLASALSRLQPLSMAQWFSLFAGTQHALLALGVFWLLADRHGMRSGFWPWVAAALSCGFALSGLAVAIALYPHFETLIPAFFLLFLAARSAGRDRLAIVFFGLGLATREDAGLHYALILGLFVLYRRVAGMPISRQRADAGFAVAGGAYFALAMAAQHASFPGDVAFARIYLGDPPLAHVTAERLELNVLSLFLNRPYIVLPAIAVAFWAARVRDASLVLGYAACMPWLGVQVLAVSLLASLLASYYAFPFLMALAWPLYASARQPAARAAIAGWFAVAVFISFAPAMLLHNPGRLGPADVFAPLPGLAAQHRIDASVLAIAAARPALGVLVVDNSVAALAPRAFSHAELPEWSTTAPDTVAFFSDGFDAARLRQIGGLAWHYKISGTPLHLAARRDLSQVPELAGLIDPE